MFVRCYLREKNSRPYHSELARRYRLQPLRAR